MTDLYEEMLRADSAELALRDAQQKLAQLLPMADWLDTIAAEGGLGGDGRVNADIVASWLRRTARGLEFAP